MKLPYGPGTRMDKYMGLLEQRDQGGLRWHPTNLCWGWRRLVKSLEKAGQVETRGQDRHGSPTEVRRVSSEARFERLVTQVVQEGFGMLMEHARRARPLATYSLVYQPTSEKRQGKLMICQDPVPEGWCLALRISTADSQETIRARVHDVAARLPIGPWRP